MERIIHELGGAGLPPAVAAERGWREHASPAVHFRHAVGHFATGVVVLSGVVSGQPIGMTVQSFTSVSLDPLLIGLAVRSDSATWNRLKSHEHLCVNILAADQEALSRRFASAEPDRFNGVPWLPAPSGAPILDGVLAWLDCGIDIIHRAGDHDVALCPVSALAVERHTAPLIYYRGGYSSISEWHAAGVLLDGLPAPW